MPSLARATGSVFLAAAATTAACHTASGPDPEPAVGPAQSGTSTPAPSRAGNPVFDGWYADPEGVVLEGRVWVYPTFSAPYDEQLHFDAFSSPDLVTWTKHPRILDAAAVPWARRAMWAPALVAHRGRYFLFFSANDIQNDAELGGIGVAVADRPEGPFQDHLGRPLIDRFHNGAQPIDQFVFRDADGAHYMLYGGWRHCNLARLNDDFTGFVPLPGGETFKEITPEGYVEGPFMFRREVRGRDRYYFMWSEGGWTGPDYSVAYAMADSVHGPFRRIGKVLRQEPAIATGAGHHSVIKLPAPRATSTGAPTAAALSDGDRYYIVYHRRPLGETDRNHRVVCIDRMEFDDEGHISPVKMTFEGIAAIQPAQ